MPDLYFERPCPFCKGQVKRQEGAPYAECTACHKRFALRSPQSTPTKPPEAVKLPKRIDGNEPFSRRLIDALKRLLRKIGQGFSALYRALYGAIRKKNQKLPLPKPGETPKTPTPEPPMDEGQRALYHARKKQLEARDDRPIPQPAPTGGERVESFVSRHRIATLVFSSLILILLLVLLITGITFCARESRINKDDFRFYYGSDEAADRREYSFVAFKTKDRDDRKLSYRIDMNALASLCGLTISGTPDAPRYGIRGGTSYVRFKKGSAIATVNGTEYQMDYTAEYDREGHLWVDLYFVDGILGGVTLTVDLEKNHITAMRNPTSEGTVLDPVYESVTISGGNHSTPVQNGGTSIPVATYKTDVSAYKEDLHPSDMSYLILANKQNPLSEGHIPADLVSVDVPRTKEVQLRQSAARALEAMFLEMAADGITDISVTSSYRSYQYQSYLFEMYVEEYLAAGLSYAEAVARVESDTAHPGYSEHQTGLSVDFWTSTMQELNNAFESTDASLWLRENAWRFGFILRYPSDKTDITGYTYESWHYRFVGVDAASIIHQNGWCFEEYLDKQA